MKEKKIKFVLTMSSKIKQIFARFIILNMKPRSKYVGLIKIKSVMI